MTFTRLAVFALLLAAAASAAPITYQLLGVTFDDGGTASGTFTFDPNAGTPCSTGASPCGRYTNVNIVTTTGTTRAGATYKFVCGQDVPTCTGVSPDSTAVLYLTSTAGDQTGLPALALFFTGVGGVPPQGLGSSSTIDISNASAAVGAGVEGSCIDAVCSAPAPPTGRATVAGIVVAVNAYQISYVSNLVAGDSYVDLTNSGATVNAAGTTSQNICVNVYTFDPSEELVSCCACPVTPNGLNSLSAKQDLVSNTLTPGVPGSVVIKLIATTVPAGGTCNASGVTRATLTAGLTAWDTTLTQNTSVGSFETNRVPFSIASLSDAELTRLTTFCGFIQANGSGFGICRSCRIGALGGAQQ